MVSSLARSFGQTAEQFLARMIRSQACICTYICTYDSQPGMCLLACRTYVIQQIPQIPHVPACLPVQMRRISSELRCCDAVCVCRMVALMCQDTSSSSLCLRPVSPGCSGVTSTRASPGSSNGGALEAPPPKTTPNHTKPHHLSASSTSHSVCVHRQSRHYRWLFAQADG